MSAHVTRIASVLTRAALTAWGRLPVVRALALGDALGRFHARIGSYGVATARTNLALAFSTLSQAERDHLLVNNFAQLGRTLADVAILRGPNRDELLAGVEIEGAEHLDAALAGGRGAVLVTAHLGSWELAGVGLAAQGWPLVAVQHEIETGWLDALVRDWRASTGMELATLGRAGRELLRALDAGKLVALLLDQNADRESGVFAPFFGHPACTRAGVVRLAMRRGTPLLPAFCIRQADGIGHRIRIEAPIEIEPAAADADRAKGEEGALPRNVARLNAAIEAAIRSAPEQWLWAHRRFRTRPPGAPRLYPKRRGWLRRTRKRRDTAGSTSGR